MDHGPQNVSLKLYQVETFVFCHHGRERTWTLTRPTFVRHNGMSRSNVRIYLYHMNGHYETVLPVSTSFSGEPLCQCTCEPICYKGLCVNPTKGNDCWRYSLCGKAGALQSWAMTIADLQVVSPCQLFSMCYCT